MKDENYFNGLAERTRGDLFALTGELRGLLLHERDACSPNCSGIGKTDRDRLPRLLQPWSRPRMHRALRAYDAAKQRQHQDDVGQPFYSDEAALTAAIDRLLTLLR